MTISSIANDADRIRGHTLNAAFRGRWLVFSLDTRDTPERQAQSTY
jgi:hypothetical protein